MESRLNWGSLTFRDGGFIERPEFGRITTARMTQIMVLLNLAPDIQEQILFLPRTQRGRDPIIENDVRPIAQTFDWNKQRRLWSNLRRSVEQIEASSR